MEQPQRRPTILRAHGKERVDDYYWMNERGDPAVTEFLVNENRDADTAIATFSRLRQSWEESWRAGEPLAQRVPAFTVGGFLYELDLTTGGSQLVRRPLSKPSRRSQTVIDTSVYGARGLGFNQGAVDISPDHRMVAVAFERRGSERFTIRLRDIERNRDLGYAIEQVGPSLVWLDNQTLLYTRLDRRGIPSQVWCHRVGGATSDTAIYQEADPASVVGVSRTTSNGFAMIVSHLHSSTEVRVIPATGGPPCPQLVMPRQVGVHYNVEHHPAHGGVIYALIQDGSGTRLAVAGGPGAADWTQWRTVYLSADHQRVFDFSVFADSIVLAESGRRAQLVVIDVETERTHAIAMPGSNLPNSCHVQFGRDFVQPVVWVISSGPTDPGSYHQVDPATGASEVIYRAPRPRRFNPDDYSVEQWTAIASDGVEIPLSVIYSRVAVPKRAGGLLPVVLHGYGAFGISVSPGFSRPALSLVDRGWVLAHAHVRGGGELGPAWHAAGRRQYKRNSITDFIACATRLAQSELIDPERMAARGASAGGLLVCAAANERPDLFRAVVARVPFVDCLTSLLDPNSRLTRSEWDEFGNPINDAGMYDYIASYSPYDNIRPCAYPAMLVTAGYRDARVPFWEPAKYVAKLRATKSDHRPLLLRTAMQSGHNDRFDDRSDESYIMAFLASQLE